MIGKSEFEELCCVVGLMTLVWAYAENGLAIMLDTIIEKAGPIEGHSEAPLSLKRKLAAFKAALRDMPALHPLQQDGGALAVRFRHLGKCRNELTHGAAFQLEEGGFEATITRVQGRKYAIENKRIEVADAVLLHREIAEFCLDIVDFMARVDAAFA